MKHKQAPPESYEHQADATLSQANPISGDKYEVLPTTKKVRLIMIEVSVTWTVQPTPLELHITIDGQALQFQMTNPVSATQYFPTLERATAGGYLTATCYFGKYAGVFLEGKSVKVEVETTGGTTQNLSARVKYAVLKP